ncbi:MAG: membrane protein insertase YidC [Gammaproteobacteria bacterium]|nr:membrane protein insertase YidC [Gammaproteobacteria bacterium]
MNTLKSYLYILLGLLFLVLVQFWFQETHTASVDSTNTQVEPISASVKSSAVSLPDSESLVSISNDLLKATIDLDGGKVVKTELSQYYKTIQRKMHQSILNYSEVFSYYAQSGYLGDELLKFNVNHEKTTQNKLFLEARSGAFLYTKTFEFGKDPYTIKQTNHVENIGALNQKVVPYSSFVSLHASDEKVMDAPKNFQPGAGVKESSGWFVLPTYSGVSYHTKETPYVKLPYTQIASDSGGISLDDAGWFSVQQRYFLNAWVPQSIGSSVLNTQWLPADENGLSRFSASMLGMQYTLSSNESLTVSETLYSGPELADVLAGIAPALNLTIDYGWLWLLSEVIFKVLNFIHDAFNNWGLAIILTTALIKLIFYKMSEKGFVASLKMKALQPRIKDIQERFKDDAAQKSQAIMALYKQEGVNPMGGCLPILIQFPFLIALYWVLVESVQLRHASFLWIPDLSSYDPYYILPLIMGLGLFFQQKLTPTNLDPAQEQAMMIMPVMMTFIFCQFPAGLALYMLTNAVLSALQQWYLTKKHS